MMERFSRNTQSFASFSLDLALSDYLALSPMPMLVFRQETGLIEDLNNAAEALLGRPRAALCGRLFIELFRNAEEGVALLNEAPERAALQYLVGGDGRHLPVQMDFRSLVDGSFCLVFLRDLRYELELNNRSLIAERNYRFLFDQAPMPILLLDRALTIVEANQAARTLYGSSVEGKEPSFRSLLVDPLDSENYHLQPLRSFLPAHEHICTSGVRLLEAQLATLRREGQSLLLVVLRDVTEGESTLAELRRAEERWRFALEGHGDGVWEWLPKTGEVNASPGFLGLFGLSAEHARRNFDFWDARVHPEDYQRMQLSIVRHFLGEVPDISDQYRMMGVDGQYRWFAIRARAIESDDLGQVERVIGTARDIHDQRCQELRERQYQEQLMHAARLASMGELVTLVAHEVTQPLTAISNYSAVARRQVAAIGAVQFRDETLHALTKVGELVAHTGEIVHRIRSFVRKGELKLTPLSINALLAEVARLAEIPARAISAEIELELEVGLPEIIGDRMQLGQMFQNLARNALDAMSAVDGLRCLRIRSSRNADNAIEVQIEDSGCGLPQGLALDVITPFFTTKADGLGIGLVICKTVVENHQGQLWASPAQFGGTVFHVTLPQGTPA